MKLPAFPTPYSCYWITDLTQGWQSAIDAGLPAIQIRESKLSPALLASTAKEIVLAAIQAGAPDFRVVLNCALSELNQILSALDPALYSNFGLHLKDSGALPGSLRNELPDKILLGKSFHRVESGELKESTMLNYCSLSPVFPTNSHEGDPGLGSEQFTELCARLQAPCFALGGITAGKVAPILRAGATGVAFRSADPGSIVRSLLEMRT